MTLTASVIVRSFGQRLFTGKPLVGMGLVHAVLHHAMPVSMAVCSRVCLRFVLLGTFDCRSGKADVLCASFLELWATF
ncbi:MAG: hypothetical protein WC922_06100 [Synergistaceae bacterium]